MRILHLLNNLPACGNGVVNAAVDLALAQANSGFAVAVASAGGEYQTLLSIGGVNHFNVPPLSFTGRAAWSVMEMIKTVRAFKPDIVHCHTVKATLLASSVRWTGPFNLVTHIHNSHNRTARLMQLGNAVITVSEAVAIEMQSRGIPARKLHVVQNRHVGSLRREILGRSTPVTLCQPAVVCVAGLNKRKNIDGLIAAFNAVWKQIPSANLYLVGNGPDRAEFEALAHSLPCSSNIHFEGFQAHPQAYMQSADLFVLASHRDPCPLVLLEARESGTAIIATNVDGIPEILDNGQAGILVPPGDNRALAQAMLELLLDPQKGDRWRSAALNGLSEHSLSRMSSEVLAVYSSLLGERSRTSSEQVNSSFSPE